MHPFRRLQLRFYPLFLCAVMIAQRALALEPAPQPEAKPELEVIADEFAIPGERFLVEVEPRTPVRDIYAYLPKVSKRRVKLVIDKQTGLYTAALKIPAALEASELTVRIVARDLERNRLEQDVRVPVLSALDCCEDEETCGLVLDPQVLAAARASAATTAAR
jgi:hypothetical protein